MQNLQITQDAQREEINILFRQYGPYNINLDRINQVNFDEIDEIKEVVDDDELPLTLPPRQTAYQRNVRRGACLCGKHLTRQNMPRHIKSVQHRTYILANPDIRETRRMWDEFVANEERRINVEIEAERIRQEIEDEHQAPIIIRRRRYVILNADEPAE